MGCVQILRLCVCVCLILMQDVMAFRGLPFPPGTAMFPDRGALRGGPLTYQRVSYRISKPLPQSTI